MARMLHMAVMPAAQRTIAGRGMLASPTAVMLNLGMFIRGSGLVASTYGMLHCRDTVERLLTKWSQGPWCEHLVPVEDWLVTFSRLTVETGSGPMYQRERQYAEHVIGRLPPRVPNFPDIVCNTRPAGRRHAGLLIIDAVAHTLVPHVRGGDVAMPIVPYAPLPQEAWNLLQGEKEKNASGDTVSQAEMEAAARWLREQGGALEAAAGRTNSMLACAREQNPIMLKVR